MATIDDVYNLLTGTTHPLIIASSGTVLPLTSAQTSAMVDLSLSAYEGSGVAAYTDLSATTDAEAIASAVSGAVVSGIGAWGDLRWSKIYGIPLDEWDAIIRSASART